jgi:putative ABC transport system permease protein
METFFNSIKYAWRLSQRRKLLSLVVVSTLAIGIGASSAIFSIVDSVLLRPLPFRESEKLVIIETVKGGIQGRVSQREIADILEGTTSFDDAAGFNPDAQYNLTDRGEPEEIPSNICQGNLFDVLGVDFVKGSAWPKEYDMKRSFGIVLTEELWKRKFDSSSNIVDETITLDAYKGYTVFGVLPSGFDFPKGMQMFRSSTISDASVINRNARNFIVVARVRGDATIEKASNELDRIGSELADRYPESNGAITFTMQSMRDYYSGSLRPYVLIACLAVLVVLIIACVNVSNLLLSAGAERDKEVAVRTVMGASGGVLTKQLLTESLVLSLIGGVLGVLLCWMLLTFFATDLLQDMPEWMDIRLNMKVLIFSIAVATLTGVLTGLAPAFRLSRFNVSLLLKESKGSSGGSHRHALRKSLVVAQLSLAIVILVGTFLLLKSFDTLRRSSPGFNPDNILTYRVALPWRKYINREQSITFYRQLMSELKQIPGVEAVAFNDNLPLSYSQGAEDRDDEFSISGQSFEEQKSNPYVKLQVVTPSYLEMMEISLLQGRWITEYDDTLSIPVAVISKTMAETVFKGQNPIGQQVKFGRPDSQSAFRSIIGVVADVRHDNIRNESGHQIYLSRWQMGGGNQFVLLKTEGPPMQFAAQAMLAVTTVDGAQSTYDMKTMQHRIDDRLWQDKVIGHVLVLFAVISVTLTTVGIYSVMSYAISLRTREFGVRKVLGAGSAQIVGIVLREVSLLAFLSLAIGIGTSLLSMSYLAELLYQVPVWDVGIYVITAVLCVTTALGAAAFPAWRATLINPVIALKNQ